MWRFIKARDVGPSHKKNNAPCQDFCDVLEISRDKVICAVLSDGAGSAKFADKASYISVKYSLKFICEEIQDIKSTLNEDDLKKIIIEILYKTRKRLLFKARHLKVDKKEFSSTILGCIVMPNVSLFFQIGDGVIISGDIDDLNCVFMPQNGEYLNTTHFLVEDNWKKYLSFKVVQSNFTRLAMSSDGLEPLMINFNNMSVHKPFFNSMFNALSTVKKENLKNLSKLLKNFLGSTNVNKRIDDDKSLILVSFDE